MNDETHKFFLFSSEESYNELAEKGNQARSLPDNAGTERWIASYQDTFLDPQTNSSRLYCIKKSGVLPTDQFNLEGIEEINLETYLQRLQWEPPIEDDLEMLDELEILD